MITTTRRAFGILAAAAFATRSSLGQTENAPLITRPIPKTGERVPAVGLGTAYVYDNNNDQTKRAANQVIVQLIESGGQLIDTASSYGDAEIVLGNVIAGADLRTKLFLATKLERVDTTELKHSLARLKTSKLDLLQLHNVSNPRQSLAQFNDWKAQGICRYTGITSTLHGDFAAVEAVLKREKPDFVQIDYSIDDREVERLPLALPDWAKDFANSWAQFFLKYLLADQRVTAVIPGTSNPAHMADNLGAMRGRLPDPDERKRMVALVESL